MKSSRILPFVLAGAVFIVIGLYVGSTANVFPVQASVEAGLVDSLFNFMLAIAVVVFLIVEGGIIYSILRFRRKTGDDSDGTYLHGNTALEITWTTIPAIIVFVLSIYSYNVFAETHRTVDNAVQVGVVGQQFLWTFKYSMPEDPNTSAEIRAKIDPFMVDSTLYVPINRPVQFNIEAIDVIHSFYVPEFRLKQDAIPGRINSVTMTPSRLGEYSVVCAELCGVGHAKMGLTNKIRVVEQAEFDKFIADLYAKSHEIATDPTRPEAGKAILSSGRYGCAGCHTLTDAGMSGTIGPKLDGVATRAAEHAAASDAASYGLVGGTDAAAYIRGSILRPNGFVVSGFNPNIMPQNFGDPTVMSADDLTAIINYLLTQTEAQ